MPMLSFGLSPNLGAEESDEIEITISKEQAVEVLQGVAARHKLRFARFMTGDLITPIPEYHAPSAGHPHIVLEHRVDRKDTDHIDNPEADIRVATIFDDMVVTGWVESWGFVPYEGAADTPTPTPAH